MFVAHLVTVLAIRIFKYFLLVELCHVLVCPPPGQFKLTLVALVKEYTLDEFPLELVFRLKVQKCLLKLFEVKFSKWLVFGGALHVVAVNRGSPSALKSQ